MASAERSERITRDQAVAVALVAAAHVPFVVLHLFNLWRYRPHYEFFPLLLAAFAWLLWKRWPREEIRHSRLTVLASVVLLLLGLACLAASVVLYSPWVGALAAFFSTGGLILVLGGRQAVSGLLPVWLMLCLLIPPPFRLDDQLIRWLQHVTAETSSAILDSLQIDHLLSGNVFRLPDRELFVAEACSGVNSLLTLIAFGVLLVILIHRSPIHTILLLITTLFWSGLVNTLRVTIVVLAGAQWGMDISSGWIHGLLGYLLVAVGFLLLLSTDQLLASVLAPVLDLHGPESELDAEDIPLAGDPLSRVWNFVVARCGFAVSDLERPAAENVPGLLDRLRRPRRAAIAFACLGLLELLCLLPTGAVEIDSQVLVDSLNESWLPERCDDWGRLGYQTQERDLTSDEGQHTSAWEYGRDDRVAQVSVDFPFLGWHELTRCYTSHGWIEVARVVHNEKELGGEGPLVEVKLRKSSGDAGFLLFCMYDGDGRPVVPRSTHWRGLKAKLARNPLLFFLTPEEGAVSSEQTTLQIQQMVVTGSPLDESECDDARQLYLRLRKMIRDRWLNRTERDGT
jgi:exosortase